MKRLLTTAALAACWLSASTTAAASDIRPSQTVGWTGFGMAVGGPVLVVGGAASALGGALVAGGTGGDRGAGAVVGGVGAMVIGGVATLAGGPMMAAGSIAGANRLRAAGSDITPSLGYATWGLWGGGIALSLATSRVTGPAGSAISLLTFGSYVGSCVTGGMQLTRNRRAAEALALAPPRKRVQLAVVPSGRGAALVGRF